ncbi:MAG TPA: phosphoribosyltransferase family protein [Thermoanaerobaculia bacterium]|jgi:hypoxanthine phosphoribosyltransferase|nr:phosphoribosyltransferase family protein [Thermoanaerobaculia bacterium]
MSPDRESLPPNIEPLFDADTVRESVNALGRKISDDLGAEDPLLIALLGGSVIFLADLVRAIGQPVRYELIDVRQGEAGDGNGAEVVQIHYPIPLDIAGQSVLVVKDVVSSGVTEPYLEQQLRDHGARSVRFAALIDMPDERKTEFELHYRALTAERQGGLLVGYGLKHAGRYGNLPSVGRLSEGS